MPTTHNLGYPRIGSQRELKWALERYWREEIPRQELFDIGRQLRQSHWQQQAQAGIDLLPVGDFAWYDQVLTFSATIGNIPDRHRQGQTVDIDTLFRMARGRAPTGSPSTACSMKKWFNTNYHYLVPELSPEQTFSLQYQQLFEEIREAHILGHQIKPVIPGPLTYLWLGKGTDKHASWDKLSLLENLLEVYRELILKLQQLGVSWLQLDEPILVLDLPEPWRQAFEPSYHRLLNYCRKQNGLKILLATYFGDLGDNLHTVCTLPVDGIHVDAVSSAKQLHKVADRLSPHQVLSVGIVNGRNIWRNNLDQSLRTLVPLHQCLKERLWLAPSCSLLHVPVDLESEHGLQPSIKEGLAFARQKLYEVNDLRQKLEQELDPNLVGKNSSTEGLSQDNINQRIKSISSGDCRRPSPFKLRAKLQQQALQLPPLPTTTIGSFPQTSAIRKARKQYKNAELSWTRYRDLMHQAIGEAIRRQEEIGLDVLVHGEAERNDMVEYFAEQLSGFAFTEHAWVQSYGSRCVKPPIIYADVCRPEPMTVQWSKYAQSLTDKPVKGMLTGPNTILCWSFVREDLPRKTVAQQIALAIRDEVSDLERADITIIQVDEPAFREGLPLRQQEQRDYLEWAAEAFRLATSSVQDHTQIHTHMCYSEFNHIISAIADMDADVITIETARSDMELLEAFENFDYPNAMGPGVYDIHSPNPPEEEQIIKLLLAATKRIPIERLWVNPDCGLKTRQWSEVDPALRTMVKASQKVRKLYYSDKPN